MAEITAWSRKTRGIYNARDLPRIFVLPRKTSTGILECAGEKEMTFKCKICNKITEGKNNNFYCNKCRETIKKASRHWEITKDIHIWIKNNRPARIVVNGQDIIKPIYIGREVVD